MAAESVARSRGSFWAPLLVSLVAACAPQATPESAFTLKLNECEHGLDACKARCAPPTSDARTCDAVLVLETEDFLYTHNMPLPAADQDVQRDLKRICDSGSGRACAASKLLAAELERNAALRATDNVEVRAGSSSASHSQSRRCPRPGSSRARTRPTRRPPPFTRRATRETSPSPPSVA